MCYNENTKNEKVVNKILKNIELRDYQKRILTELSCVSSIGLFMGTGSGKTITSLARYFENKTKNLLIICPQKIVSQWWDVIDTYTDLEHCVYEMCWRSDKKWNTIYKYIETDKDKSKCVVVNFDILCKSHIEDYINDEWTIIVDESHKIKAMGTPKKPVKVTRKCLELGEKTIYKIILTATPTEKNFGGYIDYYSQLRFLGYIDYSENFFRNRYCVISKLQVPGIPFPIPKIIGYHPIYIHEVQDLIKSCCRFYTSKYGDYDPQHIMIPFGKCPNYTKFRRERVYNEIICDNLSSYRIGKKTITSGTITGTDEFGTRYNYQDNTIKIDWLEEFLSNTDEVVSILYNYNVEKDLIEKLCKKLKKKYIIINGQVVDKPKELKKEYDVIIGQYEAFGESLDGVQNKCHLMVFYSMPESSRCYRQSLGRIDRIGQEQVPTYYHLVMEKTVDEAIYNMIMNKVEFTTKDLNRLQD